MPVHKGPMKKKAMPPKKGMGPEMMPASHKHMTPAEHEKAMKDMRKRKHA